MSVSGTAWVWEHSRSQGSARLVLLAIADRVNETTGTAWPSLADLAKRTRLGRRTVQTAIRELEGLGELKVEPGGGRGHCHIYRLPETAQDLHPSPPETAQILHPSESETAQILHPLEPERAQSMHERVQDLHPEPLEPLRRTLRAKNVGDPAGTDPRPDVTRLCDLLADGIQATTGERPTIGQRWRDACRLLLDRDHYTPQQVEALIIWSQQHEFWRTTILSMPKLRAQRLQLIAQLKRDHNGHRRQQEPASWAAIREL